MKKTYLHEDYTYIDCEFDYNDRHYHLRACIDNDGNVVDDKDNPKYNQDEPCSDIYSDTHYCIYFDREDEELQFELTFYPEPDTADEPFNPWVGNNDTPFLAYINVWNGPDCSNLEDTIQFDDIDLTIR